MSDPMLRRPVWLTPEQRHCLREGVQEAMRHNDADLELCRAVLTELLEATQHDPQVTRLIQTFAEGLRMPEGTVPVFLCDNDIDHIARYGRLPARFVLMLKHEGLAL